MSLNDQVRDRIESIIGSDDVVLFMKGTRTQPQCGFSATVAGILDGIVPQYTTFNVLDDAEIRDGIKSFSQWPTIPQLYIGREFVGGCDLVQQMYANGDLHKTLGRELEDVGVPTISISDEAARAIRDVASRQDGAAVHLRIDASWNHEFSLRPPQGNEIQVADNGIEILLDRDSAARANGLELDMSAAENGGGFSIRNPNAPRPVNQLDVRELKAKLDAKEKLELFDVRDSSERERALIAGARLLDEDAERHLEALPRDAMLVFHCHTGVRSQAVAEYYRGRGFTNVYNLAGGIDAWSEHVDPSVPRY